MYARFISSALPPAMLDRAVSAIQENSQPLREAPGFEHGYWIYDRDNNRLTAVVVFDTQEHSDASWEQAKARVMASAEALGATPEVRTGEVVHHL